MKRHPGLDHPVTFNPISFYVPPNGAGADHVAETDFRGFVSYGFRACWLGGGNAEDPNGDCNLPRPVTRGDVRHLRGGFLSYLERTIAMLWAGEVEKDGKTIDFGNNGESVEFTGGDEDLVQADWCVTPQADALMMELTVTGNDPDAIWMSYAAIRDRRNVLEVLREACQHVADRRICPGLVSLVYGVPVEPADDYGARVEKIIGLVGLLVDPCNLGEIESSPHAVVCLAGKDRLREIVSLIGVHDAVANAKGDLWAEDAAFPKADWHGEVADDDTILGYWDWVAKMHEGRADDEDESQ